MFKINGEGEILVIGKNGLQNRVGEWNHGRQAYPEIDERRDELTTKGERYGSGAKKKKGRWKFWVQGMPGGGSCLPRRSRRVTPAYNQFSPFLRGL